MKSHAKVVLVTEDTDPDCIVKYTVYLSDQTFLMLSQDCDQPSGQYFWEEGTSEMNVQRSDRRMEFKDLPGHVRRFATRMILDFESIKNFRDKGNPPLNDKRKHEDQVLATVTPIRFATATDQRAKKAA